MTTRTPARLSLAIWTIALGMALGVPPPDALAGTAAQRCAIAKLKAAAKRNTARLRCHRTALAGGSTVDPDCLATAEAAFLSRFARIEARGGCATVGDAATVETSVDACVDALVSLLPAVPTTTTTSATATTTTAPMCPTTSTTTTTTTTTDPNATTTTAPPSALCFNVGAPCGACGSGECVEVVPTIGACVVPTPVGPCAPGPPLCDPDELARAPGTGCACYGLCY